MENKIGRPPVIDQAVLHKLDEAFALGCTDDEACLFANISPSTLYNYQKDNQDFVERKEQLKKTPILQARTIVIQGMKNDPELALKYLERKLKAEFAQRTELTGSEGAPLGYIYDSDLKKIEPIEPKQLGTPNETPT